jgi:hypothetical protein
MRAGLEMAVQAGLIAQQAHIDLEGGGIESGKTELVLRQSPGKRGEDPVRIGFKD